MDVKVFDDLSFRKKSKKVENFNSIMLEKNYNKVKEEEATFGRIVFQKFKAKKGVKEISKNGTDKSTHEENIMKDESDINQMKLSDFLTLKENRGKIT